MPPILNYFEPLKGEVTSKSIWSWWRQRQFGYNLIVIVVAFISLLMFEYFADSSGLLRPGQDAEEPFLIYLGMIVGPIAWNICYCLGPICEDYLNRKGIRRFPNPFLLKAGTAFSMAVVCFPSFVWFILWLSQALKGFPKHF